MLSTLKYRSLSSSDFAQSHAVTHTPAELASSAGFSLKKTVMRSLHILYIRIWFECCGKESITMILIFVSPFCFFKG